MSRVKITIPHVKIEYPEHAEAAKLVADLTCSAINRITGNLPSNERIAVRYSEQWILEQVIRILQGRV